MLGAAGGLFVAFALLGAAAAVMPEPDVFFRSAVAPGTPRIAGASGLTRIGASMIGLDAMTIVFTGGVALLTAMLVSLLPAAQASLLRPVDALKKGKAEGGARWVDARAVLVTAQIALALILLAGAGLMIRSAERLRETGIGVDPTGLFTVRIDLPGAAYDSNRGQQFYAQLLERVSALPGVRSAALGLCAPVSGGCNGTIAWFPPAKEPFRDGRDPSVGIHWITPGLLDTLGVKLLRGRNITDQDRAGQPKVLLVSETAARRIWPNDDPIGKRMWAGQGSAGSGDPSEVVGVVSDVRYRAIETAPVPDVYLPLAQSYQSRMRLFVRTALDPSTLRPPSPARCGARREPAAQRAQDHGRPRRRRDVADAHRRVAAVGLRGARAAADGDRDLRRHGAGGRAADARDRDSHGAWRTGARRARPRPAARRRRDGRRPRHRRRVGAAAHAAARRPVIRRRAR